MEIVVDASVLIAVVTNEDEKEKLVAITNEAELIAACLAYIWMICQGLQVMASNKTALIDRTERIDKSLFRLGLDWIKYALKHRLDFKPLLHFLPLETHC